MIEVYFEGETNALQKALRATEAQITEANRITALELERRALGLFQGTVGFWQHKVDFVSDVDFTPDGVTMIAGTDDQVYYWLDKGTSVRRALLSPDWQSKTMPGSMNSGPGRGRVLIVSKKFNFPGIKARDFSGKILKTLGGELEKTFDKALKNAKRRF